MINQYGSQIENTDHSDINMHEDYRANGAVVVIDNKGHSDIIIHVHKHHTFVKNMKPLGQIEYLQWK